MFRRLFSVSSMLGKRERHGELPGSREMYMNLLHLAWPSVVEMVLMSLVGSVDTIMVAVLGTAALASVGIPSQPRMLMLTLFFALNVGVTAVVSRRHGEGRREDANHTLRNALILISFFSVFIMFFAIRFSRPLMTLAGAQADTIDGADVYFRIMMLGLPLNTMTMCINAAQRGIGNTRTTLLVNLSSNIVNIVLNYLLVTGRFGFPRMEIRGIAIASVIGFAVGFVFCILSVALPRTEKNFLHLSFRDDWRLKKEILKPVIIVGNSAALEQIFIRIGFFVYARIVAGLGTAAFAAHQIVMQFTSLSFTFGDGIGVAGTALVGQMLGKKRPDLAFLYGRASQRVALVTSAVLFFFFFGFRYQLAGLFTQEQAVLQMAADALIIVAIFQPFQTSAVVTSGCLRGAGDTKFVAVVMMLCVCLIRPGLSYIAVNYFHLGLIGTWSSSLVDMIIRMTAVYIRFSGNKWSKIKV